MNSGALVRWQTLHEHRARAGWWSSRWIVAALAGGALAAWVAWRDDAAGPIAASHAWLAGALAAFALAFFRVPFHIYWRADAALLAQLPIDGRPLFDAALARCVRAAAATTLAVAIGAVPLARDAGEFAARHVALAGALGACAAFLLPAVATWIAGVVAQQQHATGARALHVASAIVGASPTQAARALSSQQASYSPGTLLGAVPGFASSAVIVMTIVVAPWLVGEPPPVPAVGVLGGFAIVSLVAIAGVRATAPRVMALVLRDVSALDRQRLAPLEIHAPSALERRIAASIGDAALPYRKDARLVRRRYPMAIALGALAFVVLVVLAAARPRDPLWLVGTLALVSAYGIVVARRLHRAPIELARLAETLPIAASARARAKLAWIATWWAVYVVVPGVIAIARAGERGPAAVVLAVGTVCVIVAGLRPR